MVSTQYTWDYACSGANPTTQDAPLCAAAINACPTGGPLIMIWQRTVTNGAPGAWMSRGTSCDPDSVPADTGPAQPAVPPPPPRPVLTMAMIIQAFHDTPFAVPTVHAQPEGNATLVRLPAYLELRWPTTGYEPGEVESVDPGRMAGYSVKLKPVLRSATYTFGDGTSIGPTTSLGGPYPTGDIRHGYTRPGSFRATISATYGAEVSVNGGPFTAINATTTLTSPATAITVKTAKNQLVR